MSNINFESITLERIVAKGNLNKAYKKVINNKGSAGVDGMETCDLLGYIKDHPYEISSSILNGTYRPQPIKRVYIPKDNGEQRPLGIPTVIDRFVQQAVALVLSEEYEKVFSDNSFGFRPTRSCNGAITRALEYVNSGLEWVIDLDLSKFFDTVNHSKLLQLLSDRIKDGRVVSLIHRFLRAPISEDGKVSKKVTIGTPQGGVISPILANIMLNELDQLLDSRGIKFVRYADDMVILCGSKKAAERILNNVTEFVEKKLFLKVNKDKTKILHACEKSQFLGFGFTKRVNQRKKNERPTQKYFAIVHEKKRAKFLKNIKLILDRRALGGIAKVKERLKVFIRGWCNYFMGAIPSSWMQEADRLIRRRIRQLLWKQWKKPENRYKEFAIRLGWRTPSIKEYAYGSNRYWRMANTSQIKKALSNYTLEEEGWYCIEMVEGQL
ncbi:MAG: group II intron reverse transcriptase/maturase [Succinivibrio dextrinosolvens]|nr:group II intron reverse transcriptase/maturase [Succinivibrio dextrinosolvens]